MTKIVKIVIHEIVMLPPESIWAFQLTDCDGTIYKVVRCKTAQACEIK